MPPLALTQVKYACAMFAMSVNEVPGWFVTIPPSGIGVPAAATPGLVPHWEVLAAALLVLELFALELLAPEAPGDGELLQPASARTAATTVALRTPGALRARRPRVLLTSIMRRLPRPGQADNYAGPQRTPSRS